MPRTMWQSAPTSCLDVNLCVSEQSTPAWSTIRSAYSDGVITSYSSCIVLWLQQFIQGTYAQEVMIAIHNIISSPISRNGWLSMKRVVLLGLCRYTPCCFFTTITTQPLLFPNLIYLFSLETSRIGNITIDKQLFWTNKPLHKLFK